MWHIDDVPSKRYTSRRLPSTSTYSVASRYPAPGADGVEEKETTLERLRRLRSEVEELEQDVRREKLEEDDRVVEPLSDGKGKKKEVSPAVILQQLQLLRGDLGGVETIVDGAVLEAEGEKEDRPVRPEGLAQKAKESSSLLSKLGLARATVTPEEDGKPPVLSKKDGSVSQGQLEKRVADMERFLGASDADVDEVSLRSLKFYLRMLTHDILDNPVSSSSPTYPSNPHPPRPPPHPPHPTATPRLHLAPRQSPRLGPRAPPRIPPQAW